MTLSGLGVPRWAIIHTYPQAQIHKQILKNWRTNTKKLFPLPGDSYWRGPRSPKVGHHSHISTNTKSIKQIQKTDSFAWQLLVMLGGSSFTDIHKHNLQTNTKFTKKILNNWRKNTKKLVPWPGDSYWRGSGSPKVGDHSQASARRQMRQTIFRQFCAFF